MASWRSFQAGGERFGWCQGFGTGVRIFGSMQGFRSLRLALRCDLG